MNGTWIGPGSYILTHRDGATNNRGTQVTLVDYPDENLDRPAVVTHLREKPHRDRITTVTSLWPATDDELAHVNGRAWATGSIVLFGFANMQAWTVSCGYGRKTLGVRR